MNTDRIRLDDLNSAQLDHLYDRLDAAETTIARVRAACDDLHHQYLRQYGAHSTGLADARRRILSALNTSATP